MHDLGDSLSVGTAQYLSTRLETYRIERIHDVGLHAYDAAAIVAERRPTLPPVIVVSAGSNDNAQYVSDSAGRLVKMPADDGVHFERPAGDLIADEVLGAPRGTLRAPPPGSPPLERPDRHVPGRSGRRVAASRTVSAPKTKPPTWAKKATPPESCGCRIEALPAQSWNANQMPR